MRDVGPTSDPMPHWRMSVSWIPTTIQHCYVASQHWIPIEVVACRPDCWWRVEKGLLKSGGHVRPSGRFPPSSVSISWGWCAIGKHSEATGRNVQRRGWVRWDNSRLQARTAASGYKNDYWDRELWMCLDHWPNLHSWLSERYDHLPFWCAWADHVTVARLTVSANQNLCRLSLSICLDSLQSSLRLLLFYHRHMAP